MFFGMFFVARSLFIFPQSYSRFGAAVWLILGIPVIGIGLGVFWFQGLGGYFFKTAEKLEQVRGIWVFAFATLWLIVIGKTAQISFEFIRDNPSVFAGLGAVIFLAAAYLAASFFFDLPVFDLIGPNAEAR